MRAAGGAEGTSPRIRMTAVSVTLFFRDRDDECRLTTRTFDFLADKAGITTQPVT